MRAAAGKIAAQAARLAGREGAARPAAAVVTLLDGADAKIMGLARSVAPRSPLKALGDDPDGGSAQQGQSALVPLAVSRARERLREMDHQGLESTRLTCTAEPSPEIVEMAMEMGMEVATSAPLGDVAAGDILVQAVVTDASGEYVLLKRHSEGPYLGRLTGFILSVDSVEEATADVARDAAQRAGVTLDPSAGAPTLLGVMDFMEIHGDPALEYEFVVVADKSASLPPGLEWWSRRKLPFDLMPADDAWWYPGVLDGQPCRGHFIFEGKKLHLAHVDYE